MSGGTPVEAPWRLFARVMAAGAAYDGAFGLAILGPTRTAAAALGVEVPGDPIYLYLNGVFLLLLAALYALPAHDPKRYQALAPVSAAGRLLGFGLFASGWAGGRPPAFLALATADLGIGAVTLWTWTRARRVAPSI